MSTEKKKKVTPFDRYHLFRKGYIDGTRSSVPLYAEMLDYHNGYELGRKNRNAALSQYGKLVGYDPMSHVLREEVDDCTEKSDGDTTV